MLREDPALEQREMISGSGGSGGGSKGLFLSAKTSTEMQRSVSASVSGVRPSLDGGNLRNLDELVGEEEVRALD